MQGARVACHADVARIGQLVRLAISELEPTRGGVIWKAREARPEPVEDSIRAQIDDPAARVLVGTIDDVIIGYAVARIEELRDLGRLGVIDEIFVEPEARGVGVGEEMITDVIGWCQKAGCIGIDSMALPGHRETKNFFEEAGFTARKLVMHRRMTDNVDAGQE